MSSAPRILIFDIETAPNIAYVWGAWKNNIGQNQWVKKGYIMSVSWKWLGEPEIYFKANYTSNDFEITKLIYGLFDEADVVVAHNGQKFDVPMVKASGVRHGMVPPSPFFIADTLLTARKELRIVSNTLANLCEEFDLPRKQEHKKYPGFSLWTACMQGDPEAWEEMRIYNEYDVLALEALYLRLRPYMRGHPNVSRATEDGQLLCPKCGSDHTHKRGYYYTPAGLCYRRFQCLDCGGWGRSRFMEKDVPKSAGRNAL